MKMLWRQVTPIAALVVLLLVSLYLISDATTNSASFGRYYGWLLLFNSVGLVFLLGLIAYNFYKLMVQYRLREIGSRLTARMMTVFVVLTLIPVSVVYYFSLSFLHRSIDSWFDVGIEVALEDSLQLGRSALDVRKRDAVKKAHQIAAKIPEITEELLVIYLNDVRADTNAHDLTLMDANQTILAFSSVDISDLPTMNQKPAMGDLKPDEHVLDLVVNPDSTIFIRVLVPVQSRGSQTRSWLLQANFPLVDRINELTERVETAYEQYRELALLHDPLKYSFTLALSLVWLLSVLSGVWLAFVASRVLVAPINQLVEATRAVSAGDYESQIPVSGNDELGFLIRSFNTMTKKIARARSVAEQSQQQEEMQRNYLESVLEHLDSAVLTITADGRLKKVNHAAATIFNVPYEELLHARLTDLGKQHPTLEKLCEAVCGYTSNSNADWQEQVNIFGSQGRKVLMVRGTSLAWTAAQDEPEHVIVVDDITALVQAQRDSAWSEMARRLAHEIKNPLTPIQLSAERMQRKLRNDLPEPQQELLDRYSHTIVQQVDAMKTMVNAFTEYARSPEKNPERLDINELITEVAEFYLENQQGIVLQLKLDAKTPVLLADPVRVRQMLHNLIKNAFEAIAEQGLIELVTRCTIESGCDYVEIQVLDNGPGIAADVIENILEPYVTTKATGSGLGLAIVKKIAEEHGGVVWVENRVEGGARITLRLPVMQYQHGPDSSHKQEHAA